VAPINQRGDPGRIEGEVLRNATGQEGAVEAMADAAETFDVVEPAMAGERVTGGLPGA
jgi:hypothetical protein